MKWMYIAALSVIAALPASAQTLHSDLAMRTESAASGGTPAFGSNDGAAHYSYAFNLPASRGRYQPRLGLSYSSDAPATDYGVGWSLPLSYIEINTRASLATNGASRQQTWLTLDGQRKLLVAYPTGQTQTFRPDAAAAYLSASASNSSGAPPWTVTDGQGTQFTFDCVYAAPCNRYYLKQVTDAGGNIVAYSYQIDNSGQGSRALLSGIGYNNYGSGLYADVVTLAYVTNPVPQIETIDGKVAEHTLLLSTVTVSRQNTSSSVVTLSTIHSYVLGYTQSSTSFRQLLTTITERAADGSTWGDPSSFSYSTQPNTFTLGNGAAMPTMTGPANLLAPTATECEGWFNHGTCDIEADAACTPAGLSAYVDMDGDGLPDLVWGGNGFGGTSGLRWARNTSTPGALSFAPVELLPGTANWPGVVLFTSPGGDSIRPDGLNQEVTLTRMMDVNGDGRPDLVAANTTACGTSGFQVWLSQSDLSRGGEPYFPNSVCLDASPALNDWKAAYGSGTYQSVMGLSLRNNISGSQWVELIDLTGDGIVDYVVSVPNIGWKVYPGYVTSSGSLALASPILFRSGTNLPVRTSYLSKSRNYTTQDLIDMNGDGLPDLVTVVPGQSWTVQYNSGSGFYTRPDGGANWSQSDSTLGNISDSVPGGYSNALADFNRDGRVNYIQRPGGSCPATSLQLRTSTGLGFTAANAECIPAPLLGGASQTLLAQAFYNNYSTLVGDSSSCGQSGSNGLFVDLDGDGSSDYVLNKLGSASPWNWFQSQPQSQPRQPNDLLITAATLGGSRTTITYSPSTNFGLAPLSGRLRWLVTKTTATAVAAPQLDTAYWYSQPQPAFSWDEPVRLEQLGYLDTWSQDSATLILRHTHWGTMHFIEGLPTLSELAPGSAFPQPTPGASHPTLSGVFDSTTRTPYARGVVTGGCSSQPTEHPLIVFENQSVHTKSEGSNSLSSSTYVNCNIDSFGNILQEQFDADTSSTGDEYTETRTFNTSAVCKNCALEVKRTSGSTVLYDAFLHYDAPAGSYDPAGGPSRTNLTNGYLNYVEELAVAGQSQGEVPQKVAYNADGTVARVRKDYTGQDVTSVTKTISYDPSRTRVSSEQTSDLPLGNVLSADFNFDVATGLLTSTTGPYKSSDTNRPVVFNTYDAWGRVTATGLQDLAHTTAVETGAYAYAPASFANGTPASVTSYRFAMPYTYPIAPGSIPTSDDVQMAVSYLDGYGRTVQTRVAEGNVTAAAAGAQISYHAGSSNYLVSSVVYDAAGRVLEKLDPYRASSSAFAGFLPGSSGGELNTAGLHGTSYSYDAKSRASCVAYWPTGGHISAAPSPCVSSNSAAYARATALTYGATTEVGSRTTFTVDTTPDWQNYSGSRPANPARQYSNASGWGLYTRDTNLNYTAIGRDNLGREILTTRYAGTTASTTTAKVATSYDLRGRVVQLVDDSFGTRKYSYLPTGETAEIAQNFTQAQVPEGVSGVQYLYGSLGRLEKKWTFQWTYSGGLWTRTPATGTVPTSATLYSYDTAQPALAGSPALATTNWYTAGRLAAEGNGTAQINYYYDSAGRVLRKDEAFNGLTNSLTAQRTYRLDGALLSTQISGTGLTAPVTYYTRYDSAGRPVIVDDGGSQPYWQADDGGTALAYDALGRIGSIKLDNGNANVTQTFDTAGSNLPTAITSSVGTGAGLTYLYDATGMAYLGTKLSSMTEYAGGARYNYAYDSDARVTTAATTVATPPTGTNVVPGMTQTFNESYSHFHSGSASLWNLESATVGGVLSTYNHGTGSVPFEQVPTITTGANTDSYVYDANGLVTQHSTSGGGTQQQFTYDPEGHLTTIAGVGAVEETLSYDSRGLLAERVFAAGNNTYYFGTDATVQLAGGTATVQVHIKAAGSRVATKLASTMLYYHRDRLGGIIGTSTTGGVARAAYRYTTYGAVDKAVEPGGYGSELGYDGALKLSEGLSYMNARVYWPALRRFLQADDVDTRRYSYASGDPVDNTDPTGHTVSSGVSPGNWSCLDGMCGLGAAGGYTSGFTGGGWADIARTAGGAAGAGIAFATPDQLPFALGLIFIGLVDIEIAAWGLPQELAGFSYALVSAGLGADVSITHNGIQLENSAVQRSLGGDGSAITLGNFMIEAGSAALITESGSTVGDHEEQHTYQSETLGPLYLPLTGLSLLVGYLIDSDTHGPHSFTEVGPGSNPPRPWP